jgi:hypothetical protein
MTKRTPNPEMASSTTLENIRYRLSQTSSGHSLFYSTPRTFIAHHGELSARNFIYTEN